MDMNVENLDDENVMTLDGDESERCADDDKLVWDDLNIENFILLMVDEVKKGTRTSSTFNTVGWKNLVTGMTDATKKSYTNLQLRNKFNQLRVLYKDFKKLTDETGVDYDADTGMVTMEAERWEKLSKVIPSAKKFRRKGCKHFEKLRSIFGDTCATGAYAHPSTRPSTTSQRDTTSAPIHGYSELSHDPVEVDQRELSPSTPPSAKKFKKDSFASIMEKVVASLRENADRLEKVIATAAASDSKGASCDMRCEVTSLSKKVKEPDNFLDCIDILDQLPDIDNVQYAKVSKLLHDSPNWRAFFFRLPARRRLGWALNIS